MTIKEIIKITALAFGRENVVKYLNGKSTADDETLCMVNNLVALANLVISELACSYIPMVKKEVAYVKLGKVYYKDLAEQALKIRSVKNMANIDLDFKQNSEYISVSASQVLVEYEFLPSNYDLDSVIGYVSKDVSAGTLSFGVSAEFAISEGRFDEAVAFHKRYADAINELCLPKNNRIKDRCWI